VIAAAYPVMSRRGGGLRRVLRIWLKSLSFAKKLACLRRVWEVSDVMAGPGSRAQSFVLLALIFPAGGCCLGAAARIDSDECERVHFFTCQSARCCYNPRSFALCNN
ncbi:hypothetical protein, partial [Chromobacterium piscinae]|uniref:hypothetical protein n=1 Tax=Chromobacterium piscinae TaxID=686831 RepID=UPI003260A802